MPDKIKFTVDGKECQAEAGMTIYEAAKANGIYIPVLCHYEGLKPVGSCRICSVRVNGRWMAACTQPVTPGMVIENASPDVEEYRKAIIEMLFVEGNHFCPACEKSGNCEPRPWPTATRSWCPSSPTFSRKRILRPSRNSCWNTTAVSSASAASGPSRPRTVRRSLP